MGFSSVLNNAPFSAWAQTVEKTDRERVRLALAADPFGFDDFLALLSPVASRFLEPMARRAQQGTRERFGRVVQLYAPLYLSNECTNRCLYCGFNRDNEVERVTLTPEEIDAEAGALWNQDFRNVLLVTGESPGAVSLETLERTAHRLHRRFPSLSVEVYPLSVEGYARLARAGVEGVTIYQETYDKELYAKVHPGGRKADYAWRLETPARAGEAGLRKVGIGALLGLGPWRREAMALGLHALWLQKSYWQTQVSVSFPRLRTAAGGFTPAHPVSDAELAQLAFALRLLLPDAGLVLSTRETPAFRDGLAPICMTMMSAGSRTEPGGYTKPDRAEKQFQVEDRRSPAEVARFLIGQGLEPVWKDWDQAYLDGDAPDPARDTGIIR